MYFCYTSVLNSLGKLMRNKNDLRLFNNVYSKKLQYFYRIDRRVKKRDSRNHKYYIVKKPFDVKK